ncbi:hypothetical protein [Clostridium culturomicium]|uniref:hypothetical protein n=1 Tax=Clostridium culturomicium TaxID=1499683 RepID=UPI00058EB92F|nr:hypothetical protein [Clostridium culturomicium]
MINLIDGCIVENIDMSLNIILKAIDEISYRGSSNLDWINYLTGAALPIIGFYINNKFRKKDEIRNIIVMLLQNNQKLIALIYKGAYDENKIDHKEMRKELKTYNITMIMPKELRDEFNKLYSIYYLEGIEFEKRMNEVHGVLCNLKKLLDKYGEDISGEYK